MVYGDFIVRATHSWAGMKRHRKVSRRIGCMFQFLAVRRPDHIIKSTRGSIVEEIINSLGNLQSPVTARVVRHLASRRSHFRGRLVLAHPGWRPAHGLHEILNSAI